MTYQKKTTSVGITLAPIVFYLASLYAMHMMYEKRIMQAYRSLVNLQSKIDAKSKSVEDTKHSVEICTEALFRCNMDLSEKVYLDSLFDENFRLNMRLEELLNECN